MGNFIIHVTSKQKLLPAGKGTRFCYQLTVLADNKKTTLWLFSSRWIFSFQSIFMTVSICLSGGIFCRGSSIKSATGNQQQQYKTRHSQPAEFKDKVESTVIGIFEPEHLQ
jgi:hypothetical protein